MKGILSFWIISLVGICAIAQIPTKALEITGILVDGCSTPEPNNEQMRFTVGPNTLDLSNFNITFPSNPPIGICQNQNTADRTAAFNRQIQHCGLILEPGAGLLPPGAKVLFFTCDQVDTNGFSFARLTDTVYAVYQCGTAGSGYFKNYGVGAGPRRTIITFVGTFGGADTVTYIPDSLVNQAYQHAAQNGAFVKFDWAGHATYINDTCMEPITMDPMTVYAGSDTSLCPGVATTLHGIATSTSATKWSGGKGTIANPNALITTYTPSVNDVFPIQLTLTAYSKCSPDSVIDTLIINKYSVTSTGGGDTAICTNGSIALTASGGVSYTWSPGGTLTCTSCASPTASPTSTTSYFVTITDVNSCVKKDTVVVRVDTFPNIIATAAPDTQLCLNQLLTLTATGVPNIQWSVISGTATLSCNLCTSATITPSAGFTVTVSNTGLCKTFDTLHISVLTNVVPKVTINATQQVICAGQSVKFTAFPSGGGANPTYQWYKNNTPVGINSPNYTESVFSNGDSVRCVMTSSSSCASKPKDTSAALIMTITNILVPTVAINAPSDTICAGSSITYTATQMNGGANPLFTWYLNGVPAGSNSKTFSPVTFANGATVSCHMMSSAGCANPDTAVSKAHTITVLPLDSPILTIVTPADTTCAGTNVPFTATPIYPGVTPIYQWYLNGNPVGTNLPTYSSASYPDGAVISCVMTSSDKCASPKTANSNSIKLKINPVTNIAIVITVSKDSICLGDSIAFHATGLNLGLCKLQWQKNGITQGVTDSLYVDSTLVNGDTITCTATYNTPCTKPSSTITSNTIKIIVKTTPKPSITITPKTVDICAGIGATLTANITNPLPNATLYWYANNAPITDAGNVLNLQAPVSGNTYYTTYIYQPVCTGADTAYSDTATTTVHPLPTTTIGTDTTITDGQSVQLFATGGSNYHWSQAGTLSNPNIANPIATPTASTTYSVTITDAHSCTVIDTVRIILMIDTDSVAAELPTGFTPNGDGLNDIYRVATKGKIKEITVHIYNRWGQLVFESADPTMGWDGTVGGTAQTVGTYTVYLSILPSRGNSITRMSSLELLR